MSDFRPIIFMNNLHNRMDPPKPKHIIAGFFEDLELIEKEFCELSPDLRLDDFFSYWKCTRMDCLFANRFDPRELLEMIVEINKTLVPIVANQYNNLVSRVVALYLLLCISAKQPDRMRRKIRLTCEDAISLSQLCDLVKQQRSHNDARFAWYQLKKTDSIDFVEERHHYGPSLLKHRGVPSTTEANSPQVDPFAASKRDTASFIQSKIEPAIGYLDRLSTDYCQFRDILKLDEINDATVDIESNGTIRDYLEQAKSLVREYKARSC